jgi:hypothetical protein
LGKVASKTGFKGTPNKGGRPKGSLNKATLDVRNALRLIAERHVGNLNGWVQRISKKDPARAADLVLRMFEYFIPKVSRLEVSGRDGQPIETRDVTSLGDAELERIALGGGARAADEAEGAPLSH